MYFITHPAAFLPPQSEILRRCEAMTAKMKLLYNYLVYSLRGARNSRPPLFVLYGFAVYFNSIFSCSNRREITTFLSARILSLTTRSVHKALPFSRCFSSFFGLIFVFLIYPENAPPIIKSGAFYLDTITLLGKHNAKNLGSGQSVDVMFFNMLQHNMIIRVSGQRTRNRWSISLEQVVNLRGAGGQSGAKYSEYKYEL